MGRRGTKAIVPAAYVFVPGIRSHADPAAGVAWTPTNAGGQCILAALAANDALVATESGNGVIPQSPHDATSGPITGASNSAHRVRGPGAVGLTWSADLANGAGTTTLIPSLDASAGVIDSSYTAATSAAVSPAATNAPGNPVTGAIEKGALNANLPAVSGVLLANSKTSAPPRRHWAAFGAPSNGAATIKQANIVLAFGGSSGVVAPTNLTAANPAPVKINVGPTIHYPGTVSGYYATFPIPYTDVAAGVASLQPVRKITALCAMRLHEFCYQHSGSGAGNQLRISNETKGTVIMNTVSTGAIVTAGGFADAAVVNAATLVDRDVRKGDVIVVECLTGATGFTSVGGFFTCHTTGHVTTFPSQESANLGEIDHTAADSAWSAFIKQSKGTRSSVSGPATGSILCIPFCDRTASVGTGLTDQIVGKAILPCAGRLLPGGVVVVKAAGASTTTSYRIYDQTAGAAVYAATTVAGAGPSFFRQGTANLSTAWPLKSLVTKGTELRLLLTTDAVQATTFIGGYIFMHCLDHVNSSPYFD